MSKSVLLEVITPSKLFYKNKVEMVIANTFTGEEGFMANHTWACKLLDVGYLWIKEEGATEFKAANIAGGYIDVRDNFVVYTDAAEWTDEIDVERARKRKEDLEMWLKEHEEQGDVPEKDVEKAKISLIKQNSRLHLVESGGKRKK